MSKHNKGNGIYFETESTTGWILNKAFIPTGRIKRMRTRREPRILRLEKRLGKKVYLWSHTDFFYPIMRWTRH